MPAPPPTTPTPTLPQKRPQLSQRLWPEIAQRAQHESLRDLAAEYGVSHETIRAIVRRATVGKLAELAAD